MFPLLEKRDLSSLSEDRPFLLKFSTLSLFTPDLLKFLPNNSFMREGVGPLVVFRNL